MKTPDVTPDFTACPHWGKGGRYVIDPVSGQRVPAPTDDDPAAEPEANTAPAVDQPVPKKGK